MKKIIESFHNQGFAIVHDVLEDSCLEDLKRDCEILVNQLARRRLEEGKLTDLFTDSPFDIRLIHLFENSPDEVPTIFRSELHLEGFYTLFAHPRLLEIANQILGPEIRIYPNYSVRPKLPENKRTEVPWHQDAGYTSGNSDILRMMNVWTPLVPVNRRNGCMEFVPESHRNGVVQHNKDQHYLRIQNDALSPLIKRAIPIEINPKDVVIFSNLLFHRGLPNKSNHVRWSIDFRYQDATQPTLRSTVGHLLRSKISPEKAVRDATHWASLSFQ